MWQWPCGYAIYYQLGQRRGDPKTYKFASASAILIVDLYPASMSLNPAISSPMYFNFAQSRKLVRDPPECVVHLIITSSKSLHALPQRKRGRLRPERCSILLAAACWRDRKTSLSASSSSLSSRMIFLLLWKLSTTWRSDTLDWKAKRVSVRSPEAIPIASAISPTKGEMCNIKLGNTRSKKELVRER